MRVILESRTVTEIARVGSHNAVQGHATRLFFSTL